LLAWLAQEAYPLWSSASIAPDGGFEEYLSMEGTALPAPRRLRVLPRQIYAFAHGRRLGWEQDVAPMIRRSLSYLRERYQREDGLYRTLVSPTGRPLNESPFLYDHAFILLGFASAPQALGEVAHFERQAEALWGLLERRWHGGRDSFLPDDSAQNTYLANPLMHLLEACIEWTRLKPDGTWADRAQHLADLAINRLADPNIGCIYETYTTDWRAVPLAGSRRVVEPGHQFEWAWLLLRASPDSMQHRDAALRLISFAEQHGVRGEFAINEIWDDGSCRDGSARLWPQTERLKANLLAHEVTGHEAFAQSAAEAAAAVSAYLQTPRQGLWYDRRQPDGTFVSSPAPASTLYHLVSAAAQMAAYGESSPSHPRPRLSCGSAGTTSPSRTR
jgi:mannose-6-phosphate isomerase